MRTFLQMTVASVTGACATHPAHLNLGFLRLDNRKNDCMNFSIIC